MNKIYLCLVFILLIFSNCRNTGEIIATKSETNLPLVLHFEKDLFWQISIPLSIHIENGLDNGLNFDGIQQLSNFRALKLYTVENNTIQDLKAVSDIIEEKQKREYIIFVKFPLKMNSLINQDSLKSEFINDGNKTKDSVYVGDIEKFKLNHSKILESLLRNDTLFLEFSRTKPNIGFEKPIKIPLN